MIVQEDSHSTDNWFRAPKKKYTIEEEIIRLYPDKSTFYRPERRLTTVEPKVVCRPHRRQPPVVREVLPRDAEHGVELRDPPTVVLEEQTGDVGHVIVRRRWEVRYTTKQGSRDSVVTGATGVFHVPVSGPVGVVQPLDSTHTR